MSTEPLTLKRLHANYIDYKDTENTLLIEKKNEALQYLEDRYTCDYKKGKDSLFHEMMMRAIDDGLTEAIIFCEDEQDDVAVWDTDLVDLFDKKLRLVLSEQLSNEFHFKVLAKSVKDWRGDTVFKTVEGIVYW